ncbi:MAG: hypothetical protein ACLQBX_16765 [Candidatus Limnocylindrales bacterium]
MTSLFSLGPLKAFGELRGEFDWAVRVLAAVPWMHLIAGELASAVTLLWLSRRAGTVPRRRRAVHAPAG